MLGFYAVDSLFQVKDLQLKANLYFFSISLNMSNQLC